MAERDYRRELASTKDFIGLCYFLDPEKKAIGDTEISCWNTTLLALTYVMNKNGLIVGEPGFAKTTAIKVLSTCLSGYPFDTYEAAQIQGHPDQTYETMLARLDFAKLKEFESVIWLSSAYLPVKNLDEINRLPSGNQDEVLNPMETGRFNYLNSTFYTGKTPFFATANHPDDGNHVLIPPLRDRFRIHLEVGHIGATYRRKIKECQGNIDTDLRDEDITTAIINIINNPKLTVKERMNAIEKAREPFLEKLKGATENEVFTFDAQDRKAIQKQIYATPLSTEANVFLMMIDAELNWTPTYGRKRSSDPIDESSHARPKEQGDPANPLEQQHHTKSIASAHVKNGTSPRAINEGLEEYAQALAWLTGAPKVEKHHISAMVPHCLGHRLEFHDDFKKSYVNRKRPGRYGMTREMFLASELIKGVERNYSGDPDIPEDKGVKPTMDLLFHASEKLQTLTPKQREEVKGILQDTERLDHPLLREMAQRMNEEKRVNDELRR